MELGFCKYAPVANVEHCFCKGARHECCYCRYTEDELIAHRLANGYIPKLETDDDGSEENLVYVTE